MHTHGFRGYTLIELLVALAIVAILFNVCGGAFDSLIARNNRTLTMQVALTTLDRARTLAVMEAKPVGVCLLDSQSNCDATWSGGDLGVFIDANKNHIRDNDEPVLFRQPWPARDIALNWANDFRGEPIITYQENGSVRSNGTLRFKDKNDQVIQSIVISKPGRARIQ